MSLKDLINVALETAPKPDTLAYVRKSSVRMPAFIISDIHDHRSTVAARKVLTSVEQTQSDLEVMIFPAITPRNMLRSLNHFAKTKADWTYPTIPGEKRLDLKTGLTLSGYNANDINKVICCMLSHMHIWLIGVAANTPIAIFEHDAVLTRKLSLRDPDTNESQWGDVGIVGLNDPRGATRKSQVYFQKVLDAKPLKTTSNHRLVEAPWVDNDQSVPQGIAGNSAYIITPKAAKELLNKVNEVGMWPNDAIMCKQLFPYLKQAYPFYTKLQGVKSTTQG